MIKIVYVGKKAAAIDNVARSGKVWNGPGDIQEVTELQAKTLLTYPDQWALADPTTKLTVEEAGVKVKDGEQTVTVPADSLKLPVEKMTKVELRAYAQHKWGKKLDARLSTKNMIDQIEEWERDLDIKTSVE